MKYSRQSFDFDKKKSLFSYLLLPFSHFISTNAHDKKQLNGKGLEFEV